MSDMNLIEIFEINADCYTTVLTDEGELEEIAMTKATFLEIVEHILQQANGVDASTETALPIQNVSVLVCCRCGKLGALEEHGMCQKCIDFCQT